MSRVPRRRGTALRRRRRALVTVATLTAIVAAILAAGLTNVAVAPADSTPVYSYTFTHPGESSFTVPAGATGMRVTVVGSEGDPYATDQSASPGHGAQVSATLPVPAAGTTLYAEVGDEPGVAFSNTPSMYGGGAAADLAAAGGGASDIQTCSITETSCVYTAVPATDPRLVVAGGGGGGGENGYDGDEDGNSLGGAGGSAGTSETSEASGAGGAGNDADSRAPAGGGAGYVSAPASTETQVGTVGTAGAGSSSCGGSGAPPTQVGDGGDGDSTGGGAAEDGGGGGGGWLGGAGGGSGGCSSGAYYGGGGGGGAGLSWVEGSATDVSVQTASVSPEVVVQFLVAPTITSVAGATFTIGSPGSFTVTTSGGPAPSLSEAAPLPPGLSFVDNGDGTATISGTPLPNGSDRTYGLMINASNGVLPEAIQAFALNVAPAGTFTAASDATTGFSTGPQNLTLAATVNPAEGTVTEGVVTFTVLNSSGTTIGTPVSDTVSDGVVSATYSLPADTPAGTYTIEAAYEDPAGNFIASSDTSHTLTVAPAASTTTSADTTATFSTSDQNTTLNATVDSAAGTVNEGSITFTVLNSSGTTIGTPVSDTVSDGVVSATYSLPADTPAGTYTIEAAYEDPAGNFIASSDTSHTLTVGKVAQTIAFTAPASAVVGGSATLSATGGGSGAPVIFTSTTPSVCGVSGTDGITVSYTSAGTCTLEADQAGNDDYEPATSVSGSVEVGAATPLLSLSASPASGATVDTAVSLRAGVVGVAGGPTPTGSVTFAVGGSPSQGCENVALSDGTASCSLASLPAGIYSFSVTYSADSNYTSGTPFSLTGYQVAKLATGVSVSSSVSAPSYGQPVSFGASVSADGKPVTTGTVQWQVDGTALGAPVALSDSGTASSAPTSGLAVGSHTITATYTGSDTTGSSSAQTTLVVARAATTTTLAVSASALTATIQAVAPGAGTPTGTVTFSVDGKQAGTATVSTSGVASLAYGSSGSETVAAAYGGSESYDASSQSTATRDPTITADLHSAHARTRYGWYRSAVTVSFTCVAGSAALSGACPAPVTLSHSGAAQSVTRTVHDTDGGIATVTASPINIDLTPPRVRVTAATNRATYDAPGPGHPACVATDDLSGLAGKCSIHLRRGASAVTYTATATDRAGNTTTVKGRYGLLDYFVAGVTRSDGRFRVLAGHSYTVEAYVRTGHPPLYAYAAPASGSPHPIIAPMTRIAANLWAIRVTINETMSERRGWVLGVRDNGALHSIPIVVLG